MRYRPTRSTDDAYLMTGGSPAPLAPILDERYVDDGRALPAHSPYSHRTTTDYVVHPIVVDKAVPQL